MFELGDRVLDAEGCEAEIKSVADAKFWAMHCDNYETHKNEPPFQKFPDWQEHEIVGVEYHIPKPRLDVGGHTLTWLNLPSQMFRKLD